MMSTLLKATTMVPWNFWPDGTWGRKENIEI